MFLNAYYNENNGAFDISRDQGSDFAKQWANDFNPLHDADAKRFVVPGDLLFSLLLSKQGISQNMKFEFNTMVTEETQFRIDSQDENSVAMVDDSKTYMAVTRSGDVLKDEAVIESIIKQYVKFSGETFPHLLVPLMEANNVMVNPARPMVMYQSMGIQLETIDFTNPSLEVDEQELHINGKRGDVHIHFNLVADGKVVGRGEKHFLLSGLRAYDADSIKVLSDEYLARKEAYKAP